MPSYNKVMLMGNLTRDLEMRSLPSGMNVGSFSLAVNERYKDRDGNQQERANFVDCEAFGRTADVMAQYLSKGRPVFVEGKLRLDQWQDRDGNNRSKLKVVVDNFQFIDSRGEGGGSGGGGGGGGGSRAPRQQAPADNYGEPVSSDDIPF
ncbi:MAG: single-stranded DNA-binding protein [Planctomycetota bacterium]